MEWSALAGDLAAAGTGEMEEYAADGRGVEPGVGGGGMSRGGMGGGGVDGGGMDGGGMDSGGMDGGGANGWLEQLLVSRLRSKISIGEKWVPRFFVLAAGSSRLSYYRSDFAWRGGRALLESQTRWLPPFGRQCHRANKVLSTSSLRCSSIC